jgi:PD-(D/E)XK nuclease superfamily protein
MLYQLSYSGTNGDGSGAVRCVCDSDNVDHPKDVGDRSTLAVMFGLRACGYELYVPFGENTRCDLIADDGSRLLKVQCKSGRLRRGAIIFKVCSSYAHHRSPARPERDYHGQIDVFGVYCHDTNAVYIVPIEQVGTHQASLRVQAPRNGQRKGIRLAADYEIRAAPSVREGPRGLSGARGSCA